LRPEGWETAIGCAVDGIRVSRDGNVPGPPDAGEGPAGAYAGWGWDWW
jgi:hypothetical protein